jgi:hypothetical protein
LAEVKIHLAGAAFACGTHSYPLEPSDPAKGAVADDSNSGTNRRRDPSGCWRPGSNYSSPVTLIAAVAEREQVALLHYDADYDLVAGITGQPMQWVVPRGTVP